MDVLKLFVSGIVMIGLATAIFSRGNQTATVLKAAGTATSGVLGTAIKG